MPVAANTSSDVSKATDNGMVSVDSRIGLFGEVLAIDSLLTIKALRRGHTASVACTMSVASGPQAALKTSLAGTVGLPTAGRSRRDGTRARQRALQASPANVSLLYRLLCAET
ncbi:hypothetical protein MTO96_012784 [Rhipicephalus appendiculatus]